MTAQRLQRRLHQIASGMVHVLDIFDRILNARSAASPTLFAIDELAAAVGEIRALIAQGLQSAAADSHDQAGGSPHGRGGVVEAAKGSTMLVLDDSPSAPAAALDDGARHEGDGAEHDGGGPGDAKRARKSVRKKTAAGGTPLATTTERPKRAAALPDARKKPTERVLFFRTMPTANAEGLQRDSRVVSERSRRDAPLGTITSAQAPRLWP